jgi:hypothetical protein
VWQIVFFQNKDEFVDILDDIAKGATHVPCELERLMKAEAVEFIAEKYHSYEGHKELSRLSNKTGKLFA